MQYRVIDSRYNQDKDTNVMFATNDKQEAIQAADEIGTGIMVVSVNEESEEQIVYISDYQTDLALSE